MFKIIHKTSSDIFNFFYEKRFIYREITDAKPDSKSDQPSDKKKDPLDTVKPKPRVDANKELADLRGEVEFKKNSPKRSTELESSPNPQAELQSKSEEESDKAQDKAVPRLPSEEVNPEPTKKDNESATESVKAYGAEITPEDFKNPTKLFRSLGIEVTSTDAGEREYKEDGTSKTSNRTCLLDLKKSTILGMIALNKAIKEKFEDANVVVTGGTEERIHAKGTYSHENGYKLDLRVKGVPQIEEFFNTIPGEQLSKDSKLITIDGQKILVVREYEPPHFDITFYPPETDKKSSSSDLDVVLEKKKPTKRVRYKEVDQYKDARESEFIIDDGGMKYDEYFSKFNFINSEELKKGVEMIDEKGGLEHGKVALLISDSNQRLLVLTRTDKGIVVTHNYMISTGRGDGTHERNIRGSKYTAKGLVEVVSKYKSKFGMIIGPRHAKKQGHLVDKLTGDGSIITTSFIGLKGLEERNKSVYKRKQGIHGTGREERIGSRASDGCIRMFNLDVLKVYDKVEVGSLIYIE